MTVSTSRQPPSHASISHREEEEREPRRKKRGGGGDGAGEEVDRRRPSSSLPKLPPPTCASASHLCIDLPQKGRGDAVGQGSGLATAARSIASHSRSGLGYLCASLP